MAVNKRRCASCRYFQSAQLAGNGWCTHPKRQLSSDVRILVRKDELACRNSWGNDLWVSTLGSATDAEPEPAAHIQDDVILPAQKLDDEITSVIASASNSPLHGTARNVSAPEQAEDIVVGEASLVPELRERPAPYQRDETLDDGINVGAQEDQAIRLEVMARSGNQDALKQARERLRKRRMVTLKLPPDPAAVLSDTGPNEATSMESIMEPVVDPSDETTFEQKATLRPDDETQAPQVRPRSRQSAMPMRAYNDPMPPVPTHEVKPGTTPRPRHRQEQDLFDTVPAVDPDFELPLMDAATREQEFRDADEFTDDDVFLPEEQLSSYELVLQRARAIRAAAKTGHAQNQMGTNRKAPAPRPASTPAPVPAPARTAAPAPAIVRHQPAPRNEHLVRQDRREAFAPTEEPPAAVPTTDTRRSPKPKSRGRFDVSMLISRGVSFYRQEATSSWDAESGASSSSEEWNDDYDSIEEPVAPIQRESAHARSGEYSVEETFEPSETFADDYLDSPDLDYVDPDPFEIATANNSSSFNTLDDTNNLVSEPFGSHAQDWAEPPFQDARHAVSSDTHPDPYIANRQRDLYRADNDAASAGQHVHARDAHASTVPAPDRTSRSDYRIRPSYAEETGYADQTDQVAERPWQSNAEIESAAPLPVSEWSFEPQRNLDLRQDSGMDAFRARLFNKAPEASRKSAPESSRTNAISSIAVPASDDRIQRLQARGTDLPTASPQRSPLRSSSFERAERPVQSDRARGERVHEASAREEWSDEIVPSTPALPQRDSTFDLRDVLDHQGDVLDMTLSLAPDLPRSCRTCRDFRPSDSGERGWCNNAWAFTHSQMVDADDLACQSTIGCWWTPYDEVWLPEVRETAPTPRVAQMVTGSGARKRSG